MRACATVFCVFALVSSAADAAAQRRDLSRAGLPEAEAQRILDIIERPDTRHYDGATHVAPGVEIATPIVVWNGSATIAGRVDGPLVVVDGDLQLESGAVVTGDVAVVGGALIGLERATIAGTVAIYGEGFDRYAQAERRRRVADRDRDWGWSGERWHSDFGDAEFTVRLGTNYNRVEGLPVHFGPRIRTGGPAPTRIDAFAIWRTDHGSPFATDRFGYEARIEQWADRHGTLRIGGTVASVIQPIESTDLSDLEASLAAALFHEDFRDYFERSGWSAYLRVAPEKGPFDARIEYRDERHETTPVGSPWTLFNDNRLWRAQPLIAEGDIRLLAASARLDLARRRHGDFPASGWFIEARAAHRLGGTLTHAYTPFLDGDDVRETTFDQRFTTGVLDIRRYQSVGWNATLALRAAGGGTLQERGLPPQFQHALGGPGSLPGYAHFDVDCGARQTLVRPLAERLDQSFYGGYGCDRFALVQAEYRGGFDFRFRGHHDDDVELGFWNWDFGSPSWIVFFDAARGWSYASDDAGLALDTGALYDAGAGLILGDVGIYGAVPLGERSRGVRLFLRLGPRF